MNPLASGPRLRPSFRRTAFALRRLQRSHRVGDPCSPGRMRDIAGARSEVFPEVQAGRSCSIIHTEMAEEFEIIDHRDPDDLA